MATLTELRDERTTNNTDDRVGTGLRSVGMRQSVPEEYDKHYSSTYGTTLTQSQLTALNENQSKFKTSIGTAQKELDTKTTEVEGLYSANKGKLTGAIDSLPGTFDTYNTKEAREALYNKYMGIKPVDPNDPGRLNPFKREDVVDKKNESIVNSRIDRQIKSQYISDLKKAEGFTTFYDDWIKKNTVPVTVVNPNDPAGKVTYMVDKETAYNNIATIDFQGYGGIQKNADGSILVSSDVYAAQLQGQLANYTADVYVGLGDAFVPAAKTSLSDGLESLEGEYSLALDSLSSRQKQIGMYEGENANALNTIRTTYSSKLADIKDTVNSLMYG